MYRNIVHHIMLGFYCPAILAPFQIMHARMVIATDTLATRAATADVDSCYFSLYCSLSSALRVECI